ncbi:MAG: hypothetical protein LQ342_007699, partial [Letrouitia transgressa]
MPRAVDHFKSQIASILSSYRRSKTADPEAAQEEVLGKSKIRTIRSSGDKSDDSLELRDRNDKESEQHSLEPKKSVDRSD